MIFGVKGSVTSTVLTPRRVGAGATTGGGVRSGFGSIFPVIGRSRLRPVDEPSDEPPGW